MYWTTVIGCQVALTVGLAQNLITSVWVRWITIFMTELHHIMTKLLPMTSHDYLHQIQTHVMPHKEEPTFFICSPQHPVTLLSPMYPDHWPFLNLSLSLQQLELDIMSIYMSLSEISSFLALSPPSSSSSGIALHRDHPWPANVSFTSGYLVLFYLYTHHCLNIFTLERYFAHYKESTNRIRSHTSLLST